MTEQQQLLAALLASPDFTAAVEAAILGPLGHMKEKLRYHARAGETVQAAWAEGQISALESTLNLLEAFVRKSKKGGLTN